MKTKFCAILALLTLLFPLEGYTVTTLKCTHVIPVATQQHVLYKDSNLHGGRGRTFLDQLHQLGGVSTIWIAGANKTIISCFGLWACDQPYGCRYYQQQCGDTHTNSEITQLARQNGGEDFVLVGNNTGLCFSYDSTLDRVGNVSDTPVE